MYLYDEGTGLWHNDTGGWRQLYLVQAADTTGWIVVATNLSVFIQSLGQVDTHGRAGAKRARRELFALPARVIRRARRTVIPRTATAFTTAWQKLRALPNAIPG